MITMRTTMRTVHDVTAGSNLDLILRGAIGAVNRFADQVGGGLKAIALALAMPQDNSTQVQQQLDQLEQHLKAERERLQSAINTQAKG